MKTTIREEVPGTGLRHAVPPAYRELVRKKTEPDGRYTLLVFAHAERDVVTSLPVRRALRRVEATAPDGLLAVGTTFTEEALDLLAERGALVVQLKTSTWTDASAAERQL